MILGRLLAVAGALCGAVGVALSAIAAHTGGENFATAATFLLAHAPALLAVGLFSGRRGGTLLRIGGLIMLIGVLLFAADLAMRDYAGMRLFPMAAPGGGTAMILGWLFAAIGGIWLRDES